EHDHLEHEDRPHRDLDVLPVALVDGAEDRRQPVPTGPVEDEVQQSPDQNERDDHPPIDDDDLIQRHGATVSPWNDVRAAPDGTALTSRVELPGIEPGSSGAESG